MKTSKKGVGVRILDIKGYRVELNLSTQVLGIDVPDDRQLSDSWEMDEPDSVDVEPIVAPTLEDLCQPGFASAAMIAQKAKRVDDRIYASVDLATQRGAGRFPGKAHFLKTILRHEGPLPPELFVAAQLGKLDVNVPDELYNDVENAKQQFLEDDLRSKPIGFYTWNDELRQIFQQDRMLQSPLEVMPEVEALTRTIHREPTSRQIYNRYLKFVSKLTNPLVAENPDLRVLLAQLDRGTFAPTELKYFLIPPSTAHETALIKKLYGDTPIPEGFSLAKEMVRRLHSGDLSLEPTAKSGWYDYQTWSLQPLVRPDLTPEGARLELSDTYREQLVELFKGILALTRETHIKQLEIPMCGAAAPWVPDKPILNISPKLSTEPLYLYYLRRALGYRFLWTCLEAAFGPEGTAEIPTVTPEGPGAETLGEIVSKMSALFHGAAVVLSRELGGLDPASDAQRMVEDLDIVSETFAPLGSGRGEEADAEQFLHWTESRDDADLFRDIRTMVPLFYDVQRKQTKVWAFLGWSSRPATISFAQEPKASVFDSRGKRADSKVQLEFDATSRTLSYPVMAEVYVTGILDRKEFRAHCDRYETRSAILENLK